MFHLYFCAILLHVYVAETPTYSYKIHDKKRIEIMSVPLHELKFAFVLRWYLSRGKLVGNDRFLLKNAFRKHMPLADLSLNQPHKHAVNFGLNCP